jgi:hypothetical protein
LPCPCKSECFLVGCWIHHQGVIIYNGKLMHNGDIGVKNGNGGQQKILYSTLVCKQGRPLTVVVDLQWLECANLSPTLCTNTTRYSCLLLPPQGKVCGWLTLWDLSQRVANSICSSWTQRSQWQLFLLNELTKLSAGT